ncbi:hypothetical protein CERZMDRAFT_90158 [Cercospora zeae-maydis SCOH1-5]|uniref:Uncharacterized protein n=1 Tax=Cercospora zeae-maydis SCOH1-5 TaxID=717836 RepID=A0A6A6FMC2_9PEZI|nr:hypothetical protein CERZMDRAFT_90158 [Cercospora zeae-maydis SCOH1-5]
MELNTHALNTGESEQPLSAATHMSLPIDDGEFATTTSAVPLQHSRAAGDDADDTYPELEEQTTLQPPSDFKPFFTLVEDPVTGEHHHPMVHYIFADDDPDILTNAALHALHTESDEAGSTNERFVVVDMGPDGREVVSTESSSSRWQGVKSKIKQAPSWGNNSLNTQQMLCISGREPVTSQGARDLQRKKGDVSMLIKAFDETQAELEIVVGRTPGATAS